MPGVVRSQSGMQKHIDPASVASRLEVTQRARAIVRAYQHQVLTQEAREAYNEAARTTAADSDEKAFAYAWYDAPTCGATTSVVQARVGRYLLQSEDFASMRLAAKLFEGPLPRARHFGALSELRARTCLFFAARPVETRALHSVSPDFAANLSLRTLDDVPTEFVGLQRVPLFCHRSVRRSQGFPICKAVRDFSRPPPPMLDSRLRQKSILLTREIRKSMQALRPTSAARARQSPGPFAIFATGARWFSLRRPSLGFLAKPHTGAGPPGTDRGWDFPRRHFRSWDSCGCRCLTLWRRSDGICEEKISIPFPPIPTTNVNFD